MESDDDTTMQSSSTEVANAEPASPHELSLPTPAAPFGTSHEVHNNNERSCIIFPWNEQKSTAEGLLRFAARWPPSRTPWSRYEWIVVGRVGGWRSEPDIEGLKKSFQALVNSNTVTVATLDEVSRAHNVLGGKWLIYADSSKIDSLWERVIRMLCLDGKGSQAKVSGRKEGEDSHVICVYTDDYTQLAEVKALRDALRAIGVKWRIGFKTDAYTHLDIYAGNSWSIRPSRYYSNEL